MTKILTIFPLSVCVFVYDDSSFFKECPHPDEKQRQELGRALKLSPRQVKFWFQNRRTQMKVKLAPLCFLRKEKLFYSQKLEAVWISDANLRIKGPNWTNNLRSFCFFFVFCASLMMQIDLKLLVTSLFFLLFFFCGSLNSCHK